MPALWKPAQLSGVTAFSHASRRNWKWWSLDKNHGLPVVSVVFESPTKLWSSSSWRVLCEEASKSFLYLANQTVVSSKCFLWSSVRSGNGQPEIGLLRNEKTHGQSSLCCLLHICFHWPHCASTNCSTTYVATKIMTPLPHPTLGLFPEEWYHSFVWPLAPITFGRCGSNNIPISSIL